jgi:hypothetical protein
MEDFYRSLAEGSPADEALRQAKLAAFKRGESPTVWAGVTLVGDPDARVALVPPRGRWWLLGLIAALGVVGTGWAIRRRRALQVNAERATR